MFTKTAIVAALAGAAIAMPNAQPEPIYDVIQVRQVASAATSIAFPTAINTAGLGDLAACVPPASIISLAAAIPTPSGDLLSAIATITDVCAKPTFTGKLSSDYDNYSKSVAAWASKNGPALSSWQSSFSKSCSQAASLLSDVDLSLPTCLQSTALAAATKSAASSGSAAAASGAASSAKASASASGSAAAASGNAGSAVRVAGSGLAVVAGVAALALL